MKGNLVARFNDCGFEDVQADPQLEGGQKVDFLIPSDDNTVILAVDEKHFLYN